MGNAEFNEAQYEKELAQAVDETLVAVRREIQQALDGAKDDLARQAPQHQSHTRGRIAGLEVAHTLVNSRLLSLRHARTAAAGRVRGSVAGTEFYSVDLPAELSEIFGSLTLTDRGGVYAAFKHPRAFTLNFDGSEATLMPIVARDFLIVGHRVGDEDDR